MHSLFQILLNPHENFYLADEVDTTAVYNEALSIIELNLNYELLKIVKTDEHIENCISLYFLQINCILGLLIKKKMFIGTKF